MKKPVIGLFLLLCCLAASGPAWPQEASQGQTRTLVVYYSREGHTKLVAEQLARKFNADLERLVDHKKRIGPGAFIAAGKDAAMKKLTVIDSLKHNPADYDIILIGTPAWGGNMTPAVRTFVTHYDVSAKRIGLFGTAHLTGVEHCLEELADLISVSSGRQFPVLPLRHRDLSAEVLSKKIDAFFEEVAAGRMTNQNSLTKPE